MILVLALIPLLTVSLSSYFSARKVLMDGIKTYNEVLVHGMALAIEDTVLNYEKILESTGDNINYFNTIEEKKDFILKTKEKFAYNINFLALLDETGKEIIRSDDNPLKDRSEKPEFLQAKEKGRYIGWLSYNPVVDMPTIAISVPVIEKDGSQKILVAEVFFSDIWNKVLSGFTSLKDNIYFLTKEGKPIAKILATTENFRSEDLREVADNLASEEATSFEEIDTKIGKLLSIAEHIPSLNWELVVFRPTSEIYKSTLILGQRAIIIIVITLIFILFATIALSKLIIEPIRKLHKGVEIIGQGDLDYKVDIKTGDEIEQLAKEFNQMTFDLKKSRVALEEANINLEEKVKERTKELQSKLEELEKFQRLTIGRELKMVELKKQIKKIASN
ncbi:MAG: HAMP domain-containing protein [bacterium]|nr:HAMP domain-containing protein [bacterium]